jgi:hypothetical protein
MGRIVTFVLGLGVLAFAAYWYLTNGHVVSQPDEVPTGQMQHVREKTHDIEQKMQKKFDDDTAKTSQAEDR